MHILCDSASCYMDQPLQNCMHKSAPQCAATTRQISKKKHKIDTERLRLRPATLLYCISILRLRGTGCLNIGLASWSPELLSGGLPRAL